MRALGGLPPILLDEGGRPGALERREPVTNASFARVWNLFDEADVEALAAHGDANHAVARIYDLAMFGLLERRGLGERPVLVSHVVDLRSAGLPRWRAPLAVEVASARDLAGALATSCDVLVGRGFEAPGASTEGSAFVLFQLLAQRCSRPFYLHGFTGPELLMAYLAEGASGVVLPASQFTRPEQGPCCRVPLAPGRLVRLAVDPTGPERDRLAEEAARLGTVPFLAETFRRGLWEPQAEDLWSSSLRPRVLRYGELLAHVSRGAPCPSCFTEGSRFAARCGTRYPLMQGPMAAITVTPAFAKAVYEAGGFPYLALTNLDDARSEELLRATKSLGIRFGAGIVGLYQEPERFEPLARLLEEVRPDRVLVAAPRFDLVQRLLATSLDVVVHAPTVSVFRSLLALGVRRFVVSGEEAGGHVSTTSSLTAWQDVLAEVRSRSPGPELELAFAGGIGGPPGVGLISSLLHAYGLDRSLAVALQVGTPYLATDEAVALTPLPPTHLAAVLAGDETVVTGEEKRVRRRWVIAPAAEGVDRPEARYLAGGSVALLDRRSSLRELHERLTSPRGAEEGRPAPTVDAMFAVPREPIAIVGLGAIFPGSSTPLEFFENALRKRCFVRDVPEQHFERELFMSDDRQAPLASYSGVAALVGDVDVDLSGFRIPPAVARRMSRAQRLALLCTRDAFVDAGYEPATMARERVGVAFGTSRGEEYFCETVETLHAERVAARLRSLAARGGHEAVAEELLAAYRAAHPSSAITEDTISGDLASVVAGRVASVFDLHGPSLVVDAACASSLAAVAWAMDALRSGRCDVVVAGAFETHTCAGDFVKFSKLTALSATGSFPLDARGDGFVLGEGGGVLLLKRYADALRDGDRIWALLRGCGAASDGAGKGITAPTVEGQLRALGRAWDDAALDPRRVSFVECHATGTVVGDRAELETVRRFFGRERSVPIGSAKAQVGHLRDAAGLVGLFRAVLAVNGRALPPQVNFETPHPELLEPGQNLRVPRRPEPLPPGGEVLVGVSAFGFGGTNMHVVVSSAPRGARGPALDPDAFRLPELPPLANDVALVFPGQGSQYVGMLEALRDDPATRALLGRADAVVAQELGRPLTAALYPEPDRRREPENLEARERELCDPAWSQPALFVASAVLHEHVRRLGVSWALCLGHSLGEYAALYAAGALDFEDGLRVVCARGRAMAAAAPGQAGAMAYVSAGPRAVEALIAEGREGYVTCANLNSYDQTVISGDAAAVDAAVERAAQRGLRAGRLNVAGAFHSRLVASCIPALRSALDRTPLHRPSVPVLACLGREVHALPRPGAGRELLDGEERRRMVDLLCREVDHPVDFVGQVELAYEAGARRFVEVGPKGVLARLIEDVLQGKPFQSVSLDARRVAVRERLAGLPGLLALPVTIGRRPVPSPSRPAAARPAEGSGRSPDASLPLRERIRAVVAKVSGYEAARIGDDAEFERDLGIDTLKIFEILSRLRGSVLPADVTGLRHLTSVAKLEAAATSAAPRVAGAAPAVATVTCVRYERGAAGTLDQVAPWPFTGRCRVVDLDGGSAAGRLAGLHDPAAEDVVALLSLPGDGSGVVDRALPALHRLVVDEARRGAREQRLSLITYGDEGAFRESAFLALSGFVKSAQKDVCHLRFSYWHLGIAEPDEALVRRTLAAPGLGRHGRRDGTVLEGRLAPFPSGTLDPAAARAQLPSLLGPEDVVLVTGGARGIASLFVRGLLPRVRSRFVLVGRGEAPEWSAAEGQGRVEYFRADVACPADVAALELRSRPVTVLVHAAGVEASRSLLEKEPAELRAVTGVKVLGLELLVAALDRSKLRAVVSFSSTAGMFGNQGQTDYAAANGFLDGFELAGVPTLAIGWGPWAEVGMASRGVARQALEMAGAQLLGPERGLEHLDALLAARLTSPEPGHLGAAVFAGLPPGFALPDDPLAPCDHGARHDVVRLRHRFDLTAAPWLRDHALEGQIYYPGAMQLARVVEEACRRHGLAALQFTDVRFVTPLVLVDGQERSFTVERRGGEVSIRHAAPGGPEEPLLNLRLHAGAAADGTSPDRSSVAQAALSSLAALAARRPVPWVTRHGRVARCELYPSSFLGPAFQVLEHLSWNGSVLSGRVALDPSTAEALPAARRQERVRLLLEAAFQVPAFYASLAMADPFHVVPSAIDSCDLFVERCCAAGSATVLAQLTPGQAGGGFRVVVADDGGAALVHLEGYVTARTPRERRHPRALIIPSAPVDLGGARVLLVDLEEAAAYGRLNRAASYTPAEQAEGEAFPSVKRRDEKLAGKLAAKLLARDVLGSTFEDAPSLVEVEVLASAGPPSVRLASSPAALAGQGFSISHTAGLACAASAEGPVGVDVEAVRPLPEGTVADFCGERLLGEVVAARRRVAGDPRLEPLYEQVLPLVVFTQKEAVLKAAGVGLGGGLDGVELERLAVAQPVRASCGGHDFVVHTIFDEHYVLSVARRAGAGAVPTALALPAAPAPEERVVSATLGQESLWRHASAHGVGSSHNLSWVLELKGPVDVAALERAFRYLLERHEVLRTVFRDDGRGGCRAVVLERPPSPLAALEASGATPAERRREALERAETEAGRGFDFGRGPLVRALLVRVGDDEHVLALIFHHLILDCLAAFDVDRELLRCYEAFLAGRAPDLPALPAQFEATARRQRALLAGDGAARFATFWRKSLEGVPEPAPLPFRKAAAAEAGRRGRCLIVDVPAPLQDALPALGRRQNATLFATLLTQFFVACWRWTGQDDLVVATPFSSSVLSPSTTRGLLGPFAALLPLRGRITPGGTFDELLGRVRQSIFEAFEHLELPPEVLLGRPATPWFSAIVQLLSEPSPTAPTAGLSVQRGPLHGQAAKLDLCLTFVQRADALQARLEYPEGLFDEADLSAFLADLFRQCQAVAEAPTEALGELAVRLGRPGAPPATLATSCGGTAVPAGRTGVHGAAEHVAPRDQLEGMLADVLGRRTGRWPGVRADFFASGGTSLEAALLFADLEEVLGLRLPLDTLLQAPTLERLAQVIRGRLWDWSWRCLQPFDAAEGSPTFFLVHGLGGHVLPFVELARALGGRVKLIGLQARGLDGRGEPHREMGDMARCYVDEVRAVCPRGPYCLGGYSAGGLVAYEMAQLLRATGAAVPLVVLFDTAYPPALRAVKAPRSFLGLVWRSLGLVRRVAGSAGLVQGRSKAPPDASTPVRASADQELLLARASTGYEPRPYEGRVVLLRAAGTNERQMPRRDWRLVVATGLDVLNVPGDHRTMLMEPYVGVLARRLEELLLGVAAEQARGKAP